MLTLIPVFIFFFFFNDTATTEIYTLPYTTLFRSLLVGLGDVDHFLDTGETFEARRVHAAVVTDQTDGGTLHARHRSRSEEHTSELQSQSNLVCRLLLEKKKVHFAPNCHDREAVWM